MNVEFVSENPRIMGFIRMAKLLNLLHSDNSEAAKTGAIEAALEEGFITLDEAMGLYDEFVWKR